MKKCDRERQGNFTIRTNPILNGTEARY